MNLFTPMVIMLRLGESQYLKFLSSLNEATSGHGSRPHRHSHVKRPTSGWREIGGQVTNPQLKICQEHSDKARQMS